MRSDIAALIPPLVIATVFIAGVVALLRREMAPRRRGSTAPQQDAGGPSGPGSRPPGGAAGQPEPQDPAQAGSPGQYGQHGSASNSAPGVTATSGEGDLSASSESGSFASGPEDSRHPSPDV